MISIKKIDVLIGCVKYTFVYLKNKQLLGFLFANIFCEGIWRHMLYSGSEMISPFVPIYRRLCDGDLAGMSRLQWVSGKIILSGETSVREWTLSLAHWGHSNHKIVICQNKFFDTLISPGWHCIH